MGDAYLILTIILSFIGFIVLTILTCIITGNREDNTPLWEVILLCIFFTPIIALMLEMLKPYKIKTKAENKTITSAADITDEDLQKYLERKTRGK